MHFYLAKKTPDGRTHRGYTASRDEGQLLVWATISEMAHKENPGRRAASDRG